jgi:hypothetical protein
MPRRGAMWPTDLWDHEDVVALTPLAQRLFVYLWTHPKLDSGGFIALQVTAWAKASKYLTVEEVEASIDELLAANLVVVDDETEEAWVRWFIRMDSSRKPNIYIAAMRAVQTARSRTLRQAAWDEVRQLHPPPLNRDPNADAKKQKRYDDIVRDRERAYEELKSRIVREQSSNRSGTVREPPSVSDSALVSEPSQNGSALPMCECGVNHARRGVHWQPHLCEACAQAARHSSMQKVPTDWGHL